MMTNREKALAYFRNREAQTPMPGARAMYQEAIKALEQPTIEPERKKGSWTDDNACPFCGFQPWYERDIHTLSFCPNCGADMRGGKDETN